MRQELFTIWRAGPIALARSSGAPRSSLRAPQSTGADSLGGCNPAQQQGRARRPVKGSTTRQLPCRFMALGVNRRNLMAVEFGL